MNYIKQQFTAAAQNQNLVGSIFAEGYRRTLAHGLLLSEQISATPAWNNTKAYSASACRGAREILLLACCIQEASECLANASLASSIVSWTIHEDFRKAFHADSPEPLPF